MKAVPFLGQIDLQTGVWIPIYQPSILNTKYEKTFLVLNQLIVILSLGFIFKFADFLDKMYKKV